MSLVDITVLASSFRWFGFKSNGINTRKLRFPACTRAQPLHALYCIQKNYRPKRYLQETSQPSPDPLLCLGELHFLRASVQLVQRISATFFLQVVLDQAESFAKFAVQNLQ